MVQLPPAMASGGRLEREASGKLSNSGDSGEVLQSYCLSLLASCDSVPLSLCSSFLCTHVNDCEALGNLRTCNGHMRPQRFAPDIDQTRALDIGLDSVCVSAADQSQSTRAVHYRKERSVVLCLVLIDYGRWDSGRGCMVAGAMGPVFATGLMEKSHPPHRAPSQSDEALLKTCQDFIIHPPVLSRDALPRLASGWQRRPARFQPSSSSSVDTRGSSRPGGFIRRHLFQVLRRHYILGSVPVPARAEDNLGDPGIEGSAPHLIGPYRLPVVYPAPTSLL
ncbi:hypothetical protein DPEC_G00320100 [Dallia pectoralis]|uniref:Uncharacterized protein n=1 Tax=Dallia pectoralis TaxID=75939 RepID=A0ACC2F9T9_DALPE|nr:hypothetical protein DPEC_G00320100 [Dallia pectoralis]